MGVERKMIESIFAELQRIGETGNRQAFVELFAEECTFLNSMLDQPIRGRDALQSLTESWPGFVNRPEWVAIDGNRLVFGWNERQIGVPETEPAYRGISTFVFDDDGLVTAYEAFFDPAKVAAAAAARQ